MDANKNLSELQVISALPSSRFAPEGGETLLARMKGSILVAIGSVNEDGIEGGGLFIDYQRPEDQVVARTVFAFNDSGMWVVFDSADAALQTPV